MTTPALQRHPSKEGNEPPRLRQERAQPPLHGRGMGVRFYCVRFSVNIWPARVLRISWLFMTLKDSNSIIPPPPIPGIIVSLPSETLHVISVGV